MCRYPGHLGVHVPGAGSWTPLVTIIPNVRVKLWSVRAVRIPLVNPSD